MFSLGVILVSTVTFVLSTIEEVQVNEDEEPAYPILIQVIDIVDMVTVAIFSLEYLIRLLCCPRKLAFFIQPMNFVDFIALVPFFCHLF